MLNSLLSNFSSKIIIKKTNGHLSWSKAINGYVIKLIEKQIVFISPTQAQITILNDNFQKIGYLIYFQIILTNLRILNV